MKFDKMEERDRKRASRHEAGLRSSAHIADTPKVERSVLVEESKGSEDDEGLSAEL